MKQPIKTYEQPVNTYETPIRTYEQRIRTYEKPIQLVLFAPTQDEGIRDRQAKSPQVPPLVTGLRLQANKHTKQ